jgi:hypothetical protein
MTVRWVHRDAQMAEGRTTAVGSRNPRQPGTPAPSVAQPAGSGS